MKERINKYYKLFKNNPKIILRKPELFFYIPFFVIQYFAKRWYSAVEIVYLMNTVIDNHRLLHLTNSMECSMKIITSFEQALFFLKERMLECNLTESYLKETRTKFLNGDVLVLLSNHANEAVSYAFVAYKTAYLAQVRYTFSIPLNCCAVYDVYTFDKHKGKGMYEQLMSLLLKYLRENKYSRFLLWVIKENSTSIKVHNKIGVNQVIKVFKEQYRFGIRIFSQKDVNFTLSELIQCNYS